MSSTPYDDVFRTMLNDCPKLVLAVVNEAFGEHYTGEEKIIFAVQDNPNITQLELAKHIGLSVDGVRYAVKNLKAKGVLSRKGSRRRGSWLIHFE